MPSLDPSHGGQFKHRVLGTISFDTPFLGMHPGLVVSGIGSLFRPAPAPPGSAQSTRESSTGTDMAETGSISSMPTTSASLTTVSSADYTPLSMSTSNNSSINTATTNDPYYNPPFANDVNIKERSGWNSLLHFANKHVDGLTSATKQYLVSHIEFGGCLADFSGLKNRYARLRHLEDVDDTTEAALASDARRIRFVNYYTASTGLPKRVKVQQVKAKDEDGNVVSVETATENLSLEESVRATTDTPVELASTGGLDGPGAAIIPVAEMGSSAHTETNIPTVQAHISEVAPEQDEDVYEVQPMQHIDSMPIQSDEEDSHSDDDFHDAHEDTHQATAEVATVPSPIPDATAEEIAPVTSPIPDVTTEEVAPVPSPIPDVTTSTGDPALPPIPPVPEEPSPLDLSLYTDKDSRKLAEKEHKRIQKLYQTAVKHRESALKDRRKLTEKREKKGFQEREKLRRAEEKKRMQGEERRLKEEEKQRIAVAKEMELRAVTVNPSGPAPGADARAGPASEGSAAAPQKPKRDKRFCLLPGDLERGSSGPDKCWVRVYMEGVDEVGAHCGLFFPGPQYAALLGDTTERIQGWVNDDASRRAILDIHSLD